MRDDVDPRGVGETDAEEGEEGQENAAAEEMPAWPTQESVRGLRGEQHLRAQDHRMQAPPQSLHLLLCRLCSQMVIEVRATTWSVIST